MIGICAELIKKEYYSIYNLYLWASFSEIFTLQKPLKITLLLPVATLPLFKGIWHFFRVCSATYRDWRSLLSLSTASPQTSKGMFLFSSVLSPLIFKVFGWKNNLSVTWETFCHGCDIWDSSCFYQSHEELMPWVTPEGEVGSLSELFTILSLGLFWCDTCQCNSTICLLTHQVHTEICSSDWVSS